MAQDNKKASNNVIQFPGRHRETGASEVAAPEAQSAHLPKAAAAVAAQPIKKKSKKTIAGSVLAIAMATLAVNRYVYSQNSSQTHTAELASVSGISRTIASVERVNWKRDAAWEKKIAESLASSNVRNIASTEVGRSATLEEQLRWGTLEEKYTITYRAENREISSIAYQDSEGNPSYVLNRKEFLKQYASLFNAASTKLSSVEESSDKTIESYTLFDSERHAKGEARFVLDRHKRLLSLKVEPTQI